MQNYQQTLIHAALEKQALCFGDFLLKSGRKSPFFFNAGHFNDGESLALLGQGYMKLWHAHNLNSDCIFGPAYKGIPLACCLSMTLAQQGINKPWCFNRKESKDHGEGGSLIGHIPTGKVVIVDDVISSGRSIRESAALLKKAGAQIQAVMVILDRQERGYHGQSTREELEHLLDVPVYAMINLDQLFSLLHTDPQQRHHMQAIEAYREQYKPR